MARDDKLNSVVRGDQLPISVPRLKDKKLKVQIGTSCSECAFCGMARLCVEIACQRESRKDGHCVVYKEVE